MGPIALLQSASMFLALTHVQETALQLASVPLLFLLMVGLGRRLKRRHGVPFGLAYLLFSAAFSVFVALTILASMGRFGPLVQTVERPGADVSPSRELRALEERIKKLEAKEPAASAQPGESRETIQVRTPLGETLRALGALLTLLGALVIIALLRRFFWERYFERKGSGRAPKFLGQLVGLAIFTTAALLVLTVGYKQDITVLLGASGVAAILLGLALQDLLGNIIAGIALELGKPFKPGDWLVVEGRHCEVIEVNWRSTRLRDNDDIYFDIPNKQIAGTRIVNLTYPTRQHGIRLAIHFEYGTPPNLVKDTVLRATASAPGVLPTPPPKVFLKNFGDFAIDYEVRFFMDDESKYNDILDAIRTNIWYEAQRAGLRIPFPIRTLQIESPTNDRPGKLELARASLRRQPFLQRLDPAQIDTLLAEARLLRFGRRERIIEQGDEGHSMFILVHGEAEVVVSTNAVEQVVATLHEGEYCGEMSLLTGERRTATVRAVTDCELLEIHKDVLGPILAQNQPLVEQLSEMLAKRRIENEGVVAHALAADEMKAKEHEYKQGFLQRLYHFFEL